MGYADNPQEWLRLNQRYQKMDDVELLQLRDDFDDLTPIAQDILRPILQSRGIPEAAHSAPPPVTRHADYSFLRTTSDPQGPDVTDRDSLLKDNGVAVRACESMDGASLLSAYLQEHKIASLVITTKRGYPVRFPEILVFPQDVEYATKLLDQADVDALRCGAEAESAPVIEGSSQCPACGSSEILLQPSGPGYLNAWLCADCGRSWQDNLPADWKGEG
jgi:hypothetical protein